MSRRLLFIICAVVALLCLCLAALSVAGFYWYRRSQAAPPDAPVELTGHIVLGFEVASFVPCAPLDPLDEPPGYGQGYWLNADPGVELYAAYAAATGGQDYPSAYLHFVGRLSPPGQYGHLGAYSREVTVTEIIELNTTGVCPAP